MGAFIEADIGKLENFISGCQDAITEFDAIKQEFNDINSTLLTNWKGAGADAYKKETDHILENLTVLKDVVDDINNGVINDIIENYNKLDEELGEFNKNPSEE